MESPASEVDVPAPPQLPTWTLLPPCSPHSDSCPPPVPSCLWDSCLPLISSGSAYTRVEHSILSPVDLLPLWSSLPLYPTLASGLIHSVEQFPTPVPRSMDSVDSSVCGVEDSCCGWKPMPGTLLPGSSWEHFSAPSRSRPWSLLSWRLDSSHSEVSSLPMPRTEHTPGCQFGLHISASLSLWCSSVALTLPIPLQPCCTSLTGHRGKRQTLGAALIAPWGLGGRN